MIFDVVTLTSTPSITNFLVFFSVFLEKFCETKRKSITLQCKHIFICHSTATTEIFYNHLCKLEQPLHKLSTHQPGSNTRGWLRTILILWQSLRQFIILVLHLQYKKMFSRNLSVPFLFLSFDHDLSSLLLVLYPASLDVLKVSSC